MPESELYIHPELRRECPAAHVARVESRRRCSCCATAIRRGVEHVYNDGGFRWCEECAGLSHAERDAIWGRVYHERRKAVGP